VSAQGGPSETSAGVFRKQAGDEVRELIGGGIVLAGRVVMERRLDKFRERAGAERGRPSGALEEKAAEGVEIGAGGEDAAVEEELGGHVEGGSGGIGIEIGITVSGGKGMEAFGAADPAGGPEAEEARFAKLIEEDVGRAKVAVEEAGGVGGGESRGEAEGELGDRALGQARVGGEDGAQVGANAVLEHEPQVVGGLVPRGEAQHKGGALRERAQRLHLGHHMSSPVLAHGFHREVVDALFPPRLVHHRLLAPPQHLVQMIALHSPRKGRTPCPPFSPSAFARSALHPLLPAG
jgi:hypothetical protein